MKHTATQAHHRRKPKPLTAWGAGIKRTLARLGVSQAQAQEDAGLSQNSLTNLLYGDGKISTLQRLADGLHLSPAQFFLSDDEVKLLEDARRSAVDALVSQLTPRISQMIAEQLTAARGEGHADLLMPTKEAAHQAVPTAPVRQTFRSPQGKGRGRKTG